MDYDYSSANDTDTDLLYTLLKVVYPPTEAVFTDSPLTQTLIESMFTVVVDECSPIYIDYTLGASYSR